VQPRLCVVCGGSSGIGAAVCARFVREGYQVLSLSRRPCSVEGVESVIVDLADYEACGRCVEAVRAVMDADSGRIHLVHCASNYPSDSVRKVDAPGLMLALTLNITMPSLLTSAMLPLMGRGSSILFVGSTLSEKAVPGKLSYCTAKHALVGLMRSVAQDLLWSGVHTSLICPGITDTPMVQPEVGKEGAFQNFVRELQGRLIDPEEVAGVIWDTAMAPVLHGSVIHCNGGQRER